MHASEVMTQKVIAATPQMSLQQAAELMVRNRISGLPVLDSEAALIGILTEGDLLRRAELGTERTIPAWRAWLLGAGRMAGEYVHTHARTVGDVMTPKVISIAPDTPLAEAVALMEARSVKRLPVLEGGRLVGILARADLLLALQHLQPSIANAVVADADIRRCVLSQIDAQPWTPRRVLRVGVHDGIVEFEGLIFHEEERAALRVLAENIRGVRGVEDHLVWVEPMSGTPMEVPPEPPASASTSATATLTSPH